MRSACQLRILLLAAIVAAGCAGHHDSSALIPQTSRSSALVERDGAKAGVHPDHGVGAARYYLHDGEACGYIASDEAGDEWYGTCYNYVDKARLVAFIESSHAFAVYTLPDSYRGPHDIALGPNHNGIWFTDPDSEHLGYLRFSDNTLKSFYFPNSNGLWGLTAGPDNAVWFSEPNDHKIGRMDMRGFSVKEYSLQYGDYPDFMALGRDGALWFIDNVNVIGRITTTGSVTRYQLSSRFHIFYMTTGPDGAMWFCGNTTTGGSFVGRLDLYTHKRVVYVYKAGASEFMVARDSELWMAAPDTTEVDSFDITSHKIIKNRLRGDSPFGIALGVDNELYLDDNNHAWLTKVCPDKSSHQCATSP
jgi:streptogramin lyase